MTSDKPTAGPAEFAPISGVASRRLYSSLAQRFFQHKAILRVCLFGFVACVVCPIQYWAFAGDVDSTWFFGLNYAAAHHQVMGHDIVWTQGPLFFLALPMDVGDNLAKGLAFQTAVWAALLAILWDVFFRGGIPLRNLVAFSICIALSGPLYSHALAPAELLLAGALILLVQFQRQEGMGRYLAALLMLGVIPLITFVGVLLVAGVLAGLFADRIIHGSHRSKVEAALAVLLPLSVAATGYAVTIGSFHSLVLYFKACLELSRGYSSAMSIAGPLIEPVAALEALAVLAIALALLAGRHRRTVLFRTALFITLLLPIPLFVSFKHAFVRQDEPHIIHVFCFVAIALGLVSLVMPMDERRGTLALPILLLLFALIWQDNVGHYGLKQIITGGTGMRTPSLVWHALRFNTLKKQLGEEGIRSFPQDLQIEPEIRAIVQHQPVASLSMSYTNAYLEGLNLTLYPVIQRYSAYTPYLDELNAKWIRVHGPQFLIFDGTSIDGRHPWTETPAMWLETYRWYDTRLLAAHNLLLERRSSPRFSRLERVTDMRLRFGAGLEMPASAPIFWSMNCPLTTMGKLRQTLFRVSEVKMTIEKTDGQRNVFRVPLAVVESPSPGNYLPSTLPEFASLFGDNNEGFRIKDLSFGGPGSSAYMPECSVELLRLVR